MYYTNYPSPVGWFAANNFHQWKSMSNDCIYATFLLFDLHLIVFNILFDSVQTGMSWGVGPTQVAYLWLMSVEWTDYTCQMTFRCPCCKFHFGALNFIVYRFLCFHVVVVWHQTPWTCPNPKTKISCIYLSYNESIVFWWYWQVIDIWVWNLACNPRRKNIYQVLTHSKNLWYFHLQDKNWNISLVIFNFNPTNLNMTKTVKL